MEILNILADVKTWVSGISLLGVISVAWLFIRKKGWALIIDKYSKKGTIIFKEVGEFFFSLSDLSKKIDQSIKDNGSLNENSLKEAITAGKVVRAELDDVIIVIRPKAAGKASLGGTP